MIATYKIIYGEKDYRVYNYGGIQTAECIKNSKLVLFPLMGHLIFNNELRDQFDDEIVSFVVNH